MSEGAWSFRTTDGVVSVRPDAITTRTTPGRFLAGQSARWRRGTRRERLTVAFMIAGFLFSLAGFAYHVYLVATAGLNWSAAFYATSVAVFGYSLWSKYGRKTTIPRDAIEVVELDADARELTVTHETPDGPLSGLRSDRIETTLTLATDEDLRNARETLRLRGFEVEPAAQFETEIEHRIVTRDGGSFCERCGAHVSPNDKDCPACEYELWVETSPAT